MTERSMGGDAPRYETNMAVVTPTDRVRWGPIWAGLFIALSTWAVLTVLGAAIGFSMYDAGDSGRAYGVGAAIWGAISAIVSFILGGWFAARTAAVKGENNGVINGVMVWAVGIPLMLFLTYGGLSPLLGRERDRMMDRASQASAQITGSPTNTVDRGDQLTPQRQERMASTASRAAWGTLVALLLGLGSAAFGGYLGARTVPGYPVTGTRPTRHETL